MTTRWLASFGALAALLALAAAARASDTAAATPMVTLDSAEAASGATVSAQLWFVGAAADAVRNVCVRVIVPQWIELQKPDPPSVGTPGSKNAPAAAPSEPCDSSEQGPFSGAGPIEMRLKVKDSVSEGAYSIAFATHYETLDDAKAVVRHYALLEKPITLGVFGANSIAGLPLQLASLALPGLLGIVLMRLCGSKLWDALSGAAEKASATVLLSLIAVWALEHSGWSAVSASGMSRFKLFASAIVGLSIGTVAMAVERGWLAIAARFSTRSADRERRRLERVLIVTATDSFPAMAAKAIRAKCALARKAEAQGQTDWDIPIGAIDDGKTYLGSIVAPTIDDGLVLLGWGKVTAGTSLAALMQKAKAAGTLKEKTTAYEKVAASLDGAQVLELEEGVRQIQPDDQTQRKPWVRFRKDTRVQPASIAERNGIDNRLGGIPLVIS